MSHADDSRGTPSAPRFLSGGGLCGELVRAFDWAKTPLGTPETWSSCLKTTVGILLHSRHPMFLWWGRDLIQIYNDAYLPSFGIGKHPAALGQRGVECWQEIWPIISPQIEAVMQRGEASWNEDQLVPIYRNGAIEEVYWTYGYSPVFDDDGSIGGTLVVCTETTARVVAERRFDVARRLAIALLPARDVNDVTRRAADVLTQARADVPFALLSLGNGPPTAIGLDSSAAAALDAAVGQRSSPCRQTVFIDTADGSKESAVFVVALDGSFQRIVFGISPRHQLDAVYQSFLEQIAEQIVNTRTRVQGDRERRNLLEQAPVPTALMVGPEHVFEIANALYCEMVGRDVLGKTYAEAFPELRETELPKILDRVYRLGEPFVAHDMLVPLARRGSATLEDCFFTFNLEPIRDAEGHVYGMMAIANEITEQVKARRTLEEADRAKDEFLATMSHELRTPLNAILGWSRILRDGRREGAMLDKGLAVIERNASAQARLVSDLLDVSRIISGKLRLATRRIELAPILDDSIEGVRYAADAKRVQLVTHIDANVGVASADPDRLQQIVWNLLSNAVRFTPAGGTVALTAIRAGSAVRITVADTGVGIAKEQLSQIFDRFHQVDSSMTRAHGGLGLGLSIVRYLVEAHGGAVAVDSPGLGQGATFTVDLPIRSVAPPDAGGGAETASGSRETAAGEMLKDVRILAVDDDADSLELVRMVLAGAGASVTVATSAKDALAATGPFDIFVSDIGMPNMDGYALLKEIRAKAWGAAAIALTAYARAEDAEEARRAGYDEHLAKPADPSHLILTVARWARRAR